MNLSGRPFKVLFALVVILGAIFWAVDTVRVRAYSGDNLNFVVGNGPVSVTNLSTQQVPVQLASNGSRPFSVSSHTQGISGTSLNQATDDSSQLLEFNLPIGVSEFTVVNDSPLTSEVNFITNSPTELRVIVQPLSTNEFLTTIIGATVIVLGGLFYLFHVTRSLRRDNTSGEDPTSAGVNIDARARTSTTVLL